MSKQSGPYPSPMRMQRLAALKGLDSDVRKKREFWPRLVRLACVLTLPVLLILLVGCAHTSPPSQAAAIPEPPRLSLPLPSETYSGSAAKKLDAWRQRLTATPRM